jgi:hypothetical protein
VGRGGSRCERGGGGRTDDDNIWLFLAVGFCVDMLKLIGRGSLMSTQMNPTLCLMRMFYSTRV